MQIKIQKKKYTSKQKDYEYTVNQDVVNHTMYVNNTKTYT